MRPGFRGFRRFRRFRRFRGFRREGIAFGDEYEVSVTCFLFVSPLLHDGEISPLPQEGGGAESAGG